MNKQLKWVILVVSGMLLLVFGLVGIVVLFVSYSKSPESFSKNLSAVSSIFGLASSLLALVAAVIAVAAVKVWKNKLTFQKKFDLVWDAQEHLNKFKILYSNCIFSVAAVHDEKLNSESSINRLQEDIKLCEDCLIQLQRAFSKIDFLVIPEVKPDIFNSMFLLLDLEWNYFKKFILKTNGADFIRSACKLDGTESCTSKLDKLVKDTNEYLNQTYRQI